MFDIAYWKMEAVVGMTKASFPVTANIVMRFEKVKFIIEDSFFLEGLMIVDDMFVEMKEQKRVHKMYELNGEMVDLLKRADKNLNGKLSALIFLLALISQYLSGSQLL